MKAFTAGEKEKTAYSDSKISDKEPRMEQCKNIFQWKVSGIRRNQPIQRRMESLSKEEVCHHTSSGRICV